MSYVIGYIAAPFIIAFCITYFLLRKQYYKKHNHPMSNGGICLRTIGIGLLLILLSTLGNLG